jgi:hypothetical protein
MLGKNISLDAITVLLFVPPVQLIYIATAHRNLFFRESCFFDFAAALCNLQMQLSPLLVGASVVWFGS